jgi:hypothetical protein
MRPNKLINNRILKKIHKIKIKINKISRIKILIIKIKKLTKDQKMIKKLKNGWDFRRIKNQDYFKVNCSEKDIITN